MSPMDLFINPIATSSSGEPVVTTSIGLMNASTAARCAGIGFDYLTWLSTALPLTIL